MCLCPLPKRSELRRRSPAGFELFPMLDQHFPECHSISGDAIRIRAVFEQMQRIRVRVAMIKSHFRAIEQQGITSGVRFALGHRRIDIGTVISTAGRAAHADRLGNNQDTNS